MHGLQWDYSLIPVTTRDPLYIFDIKFWTFEAKFVLQEHVTYYYPKKMTIEKLARSRVEPGNNEREKVTKINLKPHF